jgi:hypothetical protein
MLADGEGIEMRVPSQTSALDKIFEHRVRLLSATVTPLMMSLTEDCRPSRGRRWRERKRSVLPCRASCTTSLETGMHVALLAPRANDWIAPILAAVC